MCRFFLVPITVLLLPNYIQAATNWDQVNDYYPSHSVVACPYNHATHGCTPGQSFTIGNAGIISSIEIYGYNQSSTSVYSREHTLSIYALIDGDYDKENAIASVTMTADTYETFQWFEFDFSEYSISVSPDDKFLMIWTSPGIFRWYANSYTYTRGDRLYRKNSTGDESFITDQDQLFRIGIDNTPITGDINKDYKIDLTDLILSLEVVAGMNPDKVQIEADVNGDLRIGITESLHIIKKQMEKE